MLPEGPRQEWVTVIGVSTSGLITVMQVRLSRVEVSTPVDGVRVMFTLGVGTEEGVEWTILFQSDCSTSIKQTINFIMIDLL